MKIIPPLFTVDGRQYHIAGMFLSVISMHGWKGLKISNKYVPPCIGWYHPPLPSTAPSKWKAMQFHNIGLIVDDVFFLLYRWLARLAFILAWRVLLNASDFSLHISLFLYNLRNTVM